MVAPRIIINGRDISPRMTTSARHVAIAQVRIEWGRASLFDQPVPGVATIRVISRGIDPEPIRKGVPLVIEAPGIGAVFRGLIADTKTTTDYLTRANGHREKISETKIVAHDPVAALSQFVPTGPSTGRPAGITPGQYSEGIGGWHDGFNSTRVSELQAAGVDRFVSGVGRPSATVSTSPDVQSVIAPRKPSDASALELMHEAYSMYRPLVTFKYRPSNDRIVSALLPDAAVAVVTLRGIAGGGLDILLDAGATSIPASQLMIDDVTLHAPAEDINEVKIEWFTYLTAEQSGGAWYSDSVEAASSAAVAGAPTGRTYVAPFVAFKYELNSSAAQQAAARYRAWWLARAAEVFGAMNGTRNLPPVTVDPENPAVADLDPDDSGVPVVWRTYQMSQAHYLNGSMFNGVDGAPAVVVFIGGVLEYTAEGWRHTLTPSVTAGGAPAPLTLDQMFPTSSTDTLDNWDDDLTVNDLAAVTRRI